MSSAAKELVELLTVASNAHAPEDLGFHNLHFPYLRLTINELHELSISCPAPLLFLVRLGDWVTATPIHLIIRDWHQEKWDRIYIVMGGGYFTIVPNYE